MNKSNNNKNNNNNNNNNNNRVFKTLIGKKNEKAATLHKKVSFSIQGFFSKCKGNCEFVHIYYRNP